VVGAYPSSTVSIPPGASVSVATVPPNRWLVITDYDQANGLYIDLVEDLAGIITVKRQAMLDSSYMDRFHSSVGICFAPGSQVVLRNRDTFNAYSMTYHLAGYWAAP
jgi:hypothetical protein